MCLECHIYSAYLIWKTSRTYKSYQTIKIMEIRLAIGFYLGLMVKELTAYGENGKSKTQ